MSESELQTAKKDQVSEIENPKSIPAGLLIPAGTGRNGPKRAKRAGILAEVEQGGDSYRFAYRYEIFRPFRPEQNGLYNTGGNPMLWILGCSGGVRKIF